MTFYYEWIEEERWKLRQFFTKRELRTKLAKNPVTLQSLIEKHIQLNLRERYPFGVPPTVITPNQSVAIVKSSE